VVFIVRVAVSRLLKWSLSFVLFYYGVKRG